MLCCYTYFHWRTNSFELWHSLLYGMYFTSVITAL